VSVSAMPILRHHGHNGKQPSLLLPCPPWVNCRAVEAVGLAAQGQGGAYIQQQYNRLLGPLEQRQQQKQAAAAAGRSSVGSSNSSSSSQHPGGGSSSSPVWPVNTHGGLLGQGAPWEVPAMLSLVEAVAQLRGEAAGREVTGAQTALVYGNGGIFSASAVAILQGPGPGRGQPALAVASKL
jgi:acetyl-CoA acetyltransferase